MFDLAVEGVVLFGRLDSVLDRRKISRDPLSGVVDGANRIFHTNYAPILSSGSVAVYVGDVPQAGFVDVDTGEITCGSAPMTQPVATYTFTAYTLQQQLSFLINGFYQMESAWPRGWKLVDGSGNPADETSDFLYVQTGDGGDPLTGNATETGLFIACCRYAYLLTQLTGGAITSFDWRETVRGMSVNKSRVPSNIRLALDAAEKAMERALQAAQDVFYGGEQAGAFIGSPMTQGYVEGLEWQTASALRQFREQRGLSRSEFPLTV